MGQEERLVVWVKAGSALSVRRFSIHEAMSRPFEVDLVVRCADAYLEIDQLIDKPASLRIDSGLAEGHGNVRVWTGVCNHFEQLRPEKETGQTKGLSTYFLRIVPRLWLLTLRRDQRVYRHKSIPTIVKELLKEWEIVAEVRLTKDASHYKELEYVVQYGESDFAFVSRLLESAGISYFFTHDPDGPTKLTLVDEPHRPAGGPVKLLWEDNPTENRQADFAAHVRLVHRFKPGQVTMRDHDFHRSPREVLAGKARPATGPEARCEHYYYEPGAFRVKDAGSDPFADEKGAWPFRHTEAEGNRRAERLLAGLRRGKRTVSFDTNCVGIAPGRAVSMSGHPRADLGPGKTMLVTEYSLDGDASEHWLFSAAAVFTDAPYAPARETPRPRIAGVQSAMVTGGGDEICPDEFGRVKVQFHWDRLGKFDLASSCWIRVSQEWAGRAFGTIFIPRVDHEVLVAYLDGDPDMPVITGRVYDLTRPVPYVLPEHDLKTLWKTKTSPKSDQANAYNELRFDDTAEDELVYVQGQRDFQELVKRNETERTGKSRALVVGENRTAIVGSADALLVGEKYSVQVIKEPDAGKRAIEEKTELKLLEQRVPDLTPLPTKLEMVDGKFLATSGEGSVVLTGGDIIVNGKGDVTFKAGGNVYVWGGPDIKINS